MMTSTAVRHVSSLVVPSTQNTAPILDFRCLYTHDLRRKAKRWQDGVLRFHTFNKRVMVYDISRNFIGDAHWRENGFIQDGDELKLDKGVLIQVGEATGSVDQDLSGIFAKRKALEDSSSSVKSAQLDPITSARGTPVSPSQLRPKTLNALLGTPKGPLGRAAIPSKSPCELRRQNVNENTDTQRPRKRPRVENPSENARPAQAEQPDEMEKRSSTRSENTVRPKISSRKKDKMVQTRTIVAKQGTKDAPVPIDLTEDSNVREKSSATVSDLNSTQPSSPKIQEKIIPSVPPRAVLSRHKYLQEDSAPMNKLQVVARKPRRKLMYKALLPPVTPANPPNTSSTSMAVEAERIYDTDPEPSESDEIFFQPPSLSCAVETRKAQPPELQPPPSNPPPLPKTKPAAHPTFLPIPSLANPPSNPTLPPHPLPNPPPPKLPSISTSTSTSTSTSKSALKSHPLNRSLSATTTTTIPPKNQPQQKRSPLRKSISDTTPLLSHQALAPSKPPLVTDSKPDPWSREAWDLFGFGRPGGTVVGVGDVG